VGELGASVETLCSSNQSMLTKLAKTRNDSIFSSHAGDGAADRLLPAPTVGTADRTSTSSSLIPLKIRCVTKKKKTEEHSLAAHEQTAVDDPVKLARKFSLDSELSECPSDMTNASGEDQVRKSRKPAM